MSSYRYSFTRGIYGNQVATLEEVISADVTAPEDTEPVPEDG